MFVQSIPVQSSNRLLPLLSPTGSVNYSTANIGLGDEVPVPEGFSLSPDLRLGHPMSESATFINVVHLIKDLGQRDINGEIGPLDFRTPQYPNPVIGIRLPPYKTTIKRKYVMWALVLAMHHMCATQRPPGIFYYSHFTLLFNGREIGGLSFGIIGPMIENAKNITRLENTPEKITAREDPSSDTNLISQQAANLTTDLTDPRLSVTFTYLGGSLNKEDLLTTLLCVMAGAALPSSETRVPNWAPQWLYGHTRFVVSPLGRPRPPYMTYYWLLEGLAATADYLIDQNRYGDIRIGFRVDGAGIGEGLFRHM
ncbi:MAG: hypothetical protein L6R38_001252 [Xanthoria sp. 2 TBL-2021]|nr:MAG: hypothetical protein L6R38_001252 [Xanthoria sp. 2 TBL-2021]